MHLILTHENPDLDGLGAALGLVWLDGGQLALSGSWSRSVQCMLENCPLDVQPMRDRDVEREQVERLSVVDTSARERLGALGSALFGTVPTRIYDHHQLEQSVGGELIEIQLADVGSCATQIVQLVERSARQRPPVWVATALLAGIHQDTGHLSYASTTPADCEAAASCLRWGADLERVNRCVRQDWRDEDVFLLGDFLRHFELSRLLGVRVGLSWSDFPHFVPDVSAVLENLISIRPCDLLCVLVRMEGRLYAILRSNGALSAADAAGLFGGDGHAHAASASVQGMTLVQALEFFRARVRRLLGESRTCGALMSAPALSLSSDDSIAEAMRAFRLHSLNSMPIVDARQRICGLVSRSTCMRALEHGMGDESLVEIASPEFDWVEAEDSFARAEQVLIGGQQALVPVLNASAQVLGVVTRTDLLRLYRQDQDQRTLAERRADGPPRSRQIERQMTSQLPQELLEVLYAAREQARSRNVRLYLAGGCVRDLLLRRESLDVDLVVEADGPQFARELAPAVGARVNAHERFGTATLVLPSGRHLDLASSRSEHYSRPGALPEVHPGSIKRDLSRRDFTINAMAVDLASWELIDYYGGSEDLREGKIRVLHSLSFIDDPTRMFRAVRFEQRFGFSLGEQSLRLLRSALQQDLLQRVAFHRIWNEFRHICAESRPARALQRLWSLGLLAGLHSRLGSDTHALDLLDELEEVLTGLRLARDDLGEPALLYGSLLFRTLSWAELHEIGLIGCLRKRERPVLAQGFERAGRLLSKIAGERQCWRKLDWIERESLEVRILATVRAPDSARRDLLRRWLVEGHLIHPRLDGRDLQRMGVPSGPFIGKLLLRLRAQVFEHGRFDSLEAERDWVASQLP